MTIDVRHLAGFEDLIFSGPGTLKIIQAGGNESLTIHAPSYVLSDIQAEVRGRSLRIGHRPTVSSLKVYREIISYQLLVKDLKRIQVTGRGRIAIPDLDCDVMNLLVTGSGAVAIDHLTADRVDTLISGKGRVTLAGDVEVQSVSVTGSGDYLAPDLVSDFASVNVTGAGFANVSVSEDLVVNITGAGSVSYAGFPEINKRISGKGKLVRRRRGSIRQLGEDA